MDALVPPRLRGAVARVQQLYSGSPDFRRLPGDVNAQRVAHWRCLGVFTFTAVVARPVAGWLLDRVGRRGVQAIAAIALAGTTLSFAWATVIWIAIGLRVLHGLAWGASSTATPMIAADVVPDARQSEGFAYFGIVPNIALMVLPPAGLWIAHQYGFPMQFAFAALLALLVLGPLVALEETTPPATGTGEFYASEALPAALLVALASGPVRTINALIPLYAPTVGLGNSRVLFHGDGRGDYPSARSPGPTSRVGTGRTLGVVHLSSRWAGTSRARASPPCRLWAPSRVARRCRAVRGRICTRVPTTTEARRLLPHGTPRMEARPQPSSSGWTSGLVWGRSGSVSLEIMSD
ncbi:MFS transporter [Halorussus sp. AFM4]|uniref:MFS transporter n=1 Tax=Halorussus sp. AFM4 TaxID=3421651 RepID=UPI003EB9D402